MDKEVEDAKDITSPLTSKSSVSQIRPKYNFMASILREENFKLRITWEGQKSSSYIGLTPEEDRII